MKKFKFSFKDNRQFLINILLTTIFGAVISLLNYLFNVYIARNFSEYNFNIYNAAIGILYLVQIPAMAIQAVITKKVAQNRDFNLTQFRNRSVGQFTVIAFILSGIFFALRVPISNSANLPVEYMVPLTFALFSAIVSPVSKGFLLGFEKIFVFNILIFLEAILKFGMGIVTVNMGLDITLPILANSLPSLVTMLLVLPFIRSNIVKMVPKPLSIDYRNLLLIFVTFFLINMPYTLDLVLVNPEFRASYGALSLVGKIVYFASITIASVMFSRLANVKERLRKRTLYISLLFSLVTGLAISLIYYIYSSAIVDLVFGGLYMEIAPYLVVYGFAMTFYAVSYMVVNYLLVKDSFIHIPVLILLGILQIIMFSVNNESLQDAFNNQIVIYSLLTLFTVLRLIFNRNINGKEENIKKHG